MKHITYKILFLALLLISLTNMSAQRNVVWVHGLEGNVGSWEHYNTIFDNERNINSLRQTYNTDFGISNMANQVILSVDNYFAHKSHNANNLAIAHSMGGLAVRDADRITHNTGKRFGGYITVTTPNYGAPIANSIINGSVTVAAQNAFNQIKAGPISENLMQPWGAWTIISDWTTTKLGNIFINNNLVDGIIGTSTTKSDLQQGSAAVNAINNYTDNVNPNIPRISIWAQENSPVHWRMFSTELYGNDHTLVNKINTIRGKYDSFYNLNNTLRIYNLALLQFYQASLHAARQAQWKKGRDWIDNSETIWNTLIKSSHSVSSTYWVEVWVPCDNTYPPMKSSNSYGDKKPIDPDCGEWVWVQRTRWVTVNDPSDGLIPKYSQIMKNNPTPRSIYRVDGANHLEVRDMTHDGNGVDETKAIFNLIFDRNGWFNTPR